MEYVATVTAGRAAEPEAVQPNSVTVSFPNPRAEPTTVDVAFTGGHLLHLAVAGCVLNDIYREAQAMGVRVDAVTVRASGGFEGEPVTSTGVTYEVDLQSPASAEDLDALLRHVDDIAEIPSALREGIDVRRVE